MFIFKIITDAQHSSFKKEQRSAGLISFGVLDLVLAASRCGGGSGSGTLATLASLVDEGLVDVGDDTTTGDGGLDQVVQLLITADGKLQVTGGDALHAEIAGSVSGQLENLGAQILQNGGHVNCGVGADATLLVHANLDVPVDAANRELKTSTHGTGLRGLLLLVADFATLSSDFTTFATFASLASFALRKGDLAAAKLKRRHKRANLQTY